MIIDNKHYINAIKLHIHLFVLDHGIYVTIVWTSDDYDGQVDLKLHLSVGQVILFPYFDHWNKHAPIIRRTVHVRARQPWRTDDLHQMRQGTRIAGRRCHRTRLGVHQEIYTDACDAFKRRIASAKSAHYCAMVQSSACECPFSLSMYTHAMLRNHCSTSSLLQLMTFAGY